MTGQILVQEYSKKTIEEDLLQLQQSLNELASMSKMVCLPSGLVMIDMNVGLMEQGEDGIYMNFTVPIEVFVQF